MSDSLLRDYLLGRLRAADAEAIEERLLVDEELYETLRSIEDDLIDEVDGFRAPRERRLFAQAFARRTSNVVPFARRRWIAVAIAAALVLAFTALLLRREPRVVAPAPARLRAAIPFFVALTLSTSRSAGSAQTITIPPDATEVRLQVHLNRADRYDRYRIELQSSHDIVWRAENLTASDDGKTLIVSADVPERVVSNGAYELAVHGSDEDLGFIELEVRR